MKTYDPKKVVVQFGNRQITGFSEDNMITIRPNGEGVQTYVGADGEVQRSLDPNSTYTVEINLANTSKSNDYLSNMYNADRATGKGVLPLLVKDMSGTLLFFAPEAWVANTPEGGRGRRINELTWTISTGSVEAPVFGGNDE